MLETSPRRIARTQADRKRDALARRNALKDAVDLSPSPPYDPGDVDDDDPWLDLFAEIHYG